MTPYNVKRDDPEAALACARELKAAGKLRGEDVQMLVQLQTDPKDADAVLDQIAAL